LEYGKPPLAIAMTHHKPPVKFVGAPSRPRSHRRWLRFSLRSLLILVTILCVWLGVKVNQARRQKEAVDALSKVGAAIRYEHQLSDTHPRDFAVEKELDVPRWLRDLAGDDFFQTVVAVQATRPVTDNDFIHLAALPRIRFLYLTNTGPRVTDAGLAHLPRPDRLVSFVAGGTAVGNEFAKRLATADGMDTLFLGGTRVSDEGLLALSTLGQLLNLSIDNTEVTDAGLDALQGMRELRCLRLDGTRITDAGLAKLAWHKALTTVQLNRTAVTDAGLRRLATLSSLNEVELEGTQVRGPGLATIASRLTVLVLRDTLIDDTSLAHLKEARNLQAINLEGTAITDAGLLHLHGLPKLSAICLEGTQVTKEGIAQLTKAPPTLAIVTAPKGT
jgi:Leucine Rich repeat